MQVTPIRKVVSIKPFWLMVVKFECSPAARLIGVWALFRFNCLQQPRDSRAQSRKPEICGQNELESNVISATNFRLPPTSSTRRHSTRTSTATIMMDQVETHKVYENVNVILFSCGLVKCDQANNFETQTSAKNDHPLDRRIVSNESEFARSQRLANPLEE